MLFSCRDQDATPNLIDLENGRNLYKLWIIDEYEDNDYFLDYNHSKCSVLIKNEVYVDSVYFGPFEKTNRAVKFARRSGKSSVNQVTTISIKKKQGVYEDLWTFKNRVYTENKVNCKDCYSIYDIRISADEAFFKYQGNERAGLKVIFSEPNDGDGFRMYNFYFVRNEKEWKLAYKEKIDTHPDAETHYIRDNSGRFHNGSNVSKYINLADLHDYRSDILN